MARQNNEPTGARKGKRQSVPATVFEFPRSESIPGQSDARDFAAPPKALSSTEQALYNELIATARTLAKRDVPGVYARRSPTKRTPGSAIESRATVYVLAHQTT